MGEFIEIDGSHGEGGGQILRTSVSLAALTGRAVRIHNIRAGRSRPGLAPQHLCAVRAAGSLCAGTLEGDEPGSRELRFTPHAPPQAGRYRFDVGTAGAACLVLQTVLLPLALAGSLSEVTITGGTHVPHAPTADYLEQVYLPALAAWGLPASLEVRRLGFLPAGGGELHLTIEPRREGGAGAPAAPPVAVCTVGSLPQHVAQRGVAELQEWARARKLALSVTVRDLPSGGPGAAVLLAHRGRAGFTALGARGLPMERVVRNACRDYVNWLRSGAEVDEHLADQLVLPAAVQPGEREWTTPAPTPHLRTVVWVVRRFLPLEAALDETPGGVWRVRMRSEGGVAARAG